MTTREKLDAVHFTDKRINAKLERIKRLESLAEHCTSTITGMPQERGNVSRIESTIEKIEALQETTAQDIELLLNQINDVDEIIAKIKSPLGKIIFELRYINFMSWPEISMQIGYQKRYLQKVHKKILKSIEEEEGRV